MDISVDHAVEVLNEALKADAEVISRLVNQRLPCNDVLANHPTIQVAPHVVKEGDFAYANYEVGLLGIINGLFGVDDKGWGFIAARFKDGRLDGFEKRPAAEAAYVDQELWLVQQFVGGYWSEREQNWVDCVYEFQGIFDSREKAVAACLNERYLINKVSLNKPSPDEKVFFPDTEFPLRKEDLPSGHAGTTT